MGYGKRNSNGWSGPLGRTVSADLEIEGAAKAAPFIFLSDTCGLILQVQNFATISAAAQHTRYSPPSAPTIIATCVLARYFRRYATCRLTANIPGTAM